MSSLPCKIRHEKEYEALEQLASALRPINLNKQHNCVDDKISHKTFSWYDMTVDIITDKDMNLVKGEFRTSDPSGDSGKIEAINSRGIHEQRSKPCRVNETHIHQGENHVHFTCNLPYYTDIDDLSDLLSDLIRIRLPS